MNIEETEMKFKVTVTGKVEPLKLQQKFQKKLKKSVELISPKPNEEKEISKKTMLEMSLGCDKCIKKMQKIVTKTEGKDFVFTIFMVPFYLLYLNFLFNYSMDFF